EQQRKREQHQRFHGYLLPCTHLPGAAFTRSCDHSPSRLCAPPRHPGLEPGPAFIFQLEGRQARDQVGGEVTEPRENAWRSLGPLNFTSLRRFFDRRPTRE